jgi:hypothetical protein
MPDITKWSGQAPTRPAAPPAAAAGGKAMSKAAAPPPPAIRCDKPLHSLYRFSQLPPEARRGLPEEGELDSWVDRPEAVRSGGDLALRASGWRLAPHSLIRFTLRRPATALGPGRVAPLSGSTWQVAEHDVTWLRPVGRHDVGTGGGGGAGGAGPSFPVLETISGALARAPEEVRALFAGRPEWVDDYGLSTDGEWTWGRVALWKDRVTWVRATVKGWTAGEWRISDAPSGGALVHRE